MLELMVESPGIFTTVQDMGRYGFQRLGMPVSGAMDDYALQVANLLVGNRRGEAALEVTFSGFAVRFKGEGRASVAGADLGAKLNCLPVKPWQSFITRTGDVLAFTAVKKGCRAYLAIEGGIDVPEVMGSRSTYTKGEIGGHVGRRLAAGDLLKGGDVRTISFGGAIRLPEELIPDYSSKRIRIVFGPQNDYFHKDELKKFLGSEYLITNQCDRMGYRLEGPPIYHIGGPDIISDGIALGAVQVPGHGRPIIMMRDRQTTGGYTKIANVITVDVALLAQLKPGDSIEFTEISVEEAQILFRRREELIKKVEMLMKDKGRFAEFIIRMENGDYRVNVQYL